MITIPDLRAIDMTAIPEALQPQLTAMLANEALLDLTFVLIIEAGDSEEAIIEEIGWSPLVEPFDGIRFGEPAFEPFWDWLSEADGWYRLIKTVGNDGFAYILFIEADGKGDLQTLCQEFSII